MTGKSSKQMSMKGIKEQGYGIDEAVRDICSVSVAPASKSAVKQILEKLLASERQAVIRECLEAVENIGVEENPPDNGMVIWNKCAEAIKILGKEL